MFQQLDRTHDRESFDCGVEELNNHLKKYARQNDEKGLGKTVVVVSDDNLKKIFGFYTISTGQIEIGSLPKEQRKKLPRYPLPVIRIGRFAVDIEFQGKGLGTALLMHALKNAEAVADRIGVYAVVLDAKDDKAKSFYLKCGFISLNNAPLKMFLPIRSIPA